jgi:uncharacterized protein (DUF305 family)
MDAFPRVIAAALSSSLLLLTACSNSGDAEPTTATATTGFNAADVAFAQGMIPHHDEALTMARLAGAAGASKAVRKLAQEIEAAQDPEISLMRGWLIAWERPTAMPIDHGAMAGMEKMDGMASAADLAQLRAARGAAFDHLFLTLMRTHHLGAIEMARTELRDGANADAKALAGRIESGQSAEVKRIEKLLRKR